MWVPLASVLEVVAFVDHIRTLTDQTGTLTLRGEGGVALPITPSTLALTPETRPLLSR